MKFLTTALVAVGFAVGTLPAKANLAATYLMNSPVLDAVKSTDALVLIDSPACRKDGLFGVYEAGTKYGNILHICLARHHNDMRELQDTVKHEAIHVAQYCRNSVLLNPSLVAKEATSSDLSNLANYASSQRAIELEARVLARKLSEEQVADVVMRHCRK
jgi:hypothetical protein